MVAELINKYIWIIQTLLRYGNTGLTLEQIQSRWHSRWGGEYSRKTFHNHREQIEEIFNIKIHCDRSTNCYFIEHSDDVSDEQANSQWLINTFTVNSLLEMGKERLSGRIAVENIPSGQKYLTVLMNAMLEGHVVQISYHKYNQTHSDTYHIRPYALKEFLKRWYLIGWSEERKSIRVYGLDRICDIQETEVQFTFPGDWDVEAYFANSFGVYKDDSIRVERILFATTHSEANFLDDLPIHESQRKLESVPKELLPLPEEMKVVYEITVAPNYSLLQEFCRHMDKILVLSPASLKKRMAETVREMASFYDGNQDG